MDVMKISVDTINLYSNKKSRFRFYFHYSFSLKMIWIKLQFHVFYLLLSIVNLEAMKRCIISSSKGRETNIPVTILTIPDFFQQYK